MEKFVVRALVVSSLTGGLVSVAVAQDYDPNYDALSHSDGISLSGGNATRSNIAIQTPNPRPRYINDFDFDMPGQQGVDLMSNYLSKYAAPVAATPAPQTVINISK